MDLSSLRGGAGAPIVPPLPTGLHFITFISKMIVYTSTIRKGNQVDNVREYIAQQLYLYVQTFSYVEFVCLSTCVKLTRISLYLVPDSNRNKKKRKKKSGLILNLHWQLDQLWNKMEGHETGISLFVMWSVLTFDFNYHQTWFRSSNMLVRATLRSSELITESAKI